MKMKPVRAMTLLLTLTLLFGGLLPTVHGADALCPEAYCEMFPAVESEEIALFADDSMLGTVLNGKKIMFCGDSLLMGYGLDDYRQSWPSRLASDYGMLITNNAIPASTFGVSVKQGYYPGGCYEPICQRALPAEQFDVILVAGSGNDWYCETPLGNDLDSRNVGTLSGALNVVIDRLQAQYPGALILFATSWNSTGAKNGLGYTTDDYNQIVMEVCSRRNIACLKACDPAVSGIDASSASFRKEYFITDTDFWHLNAKGQKRYLPVVAQWLQTQLLEQYTVAGFYDVTVRDWYADAVAYGVANGITRGTSETTFSPMMETQRGMIITMLYRLAGSPGGTAALPFVDVVEDAYYYDALVWAYQNGITNGVSDTNAGMEQPLTREQIVCFLYRYAAGAASGNALSRFTDADQVSDFAVEAMNWAVELGILNGGGDGTIAPQRVATRAELIQILVRFVQE